MPRIIISVPVNRYSSNRFVLPEMSAVDAEEIACRLARAQLMERKSCGDEYVMVTDASAGISVEIADSEVVMTPKQHAIAVADHEREVARKAEEKAAKARALADLVEA